METTTLQRLLKYPHAAVFDKAPGQELAFLLRHDDGASWRIADRSMVIEVGGVESVYKLGDYNVGELADRLRNDGFDVSNLTNDYRYLSALALVEGEGDQLVSNGDRVFVFTSLLWVLLSCYAAEVMNASEQIVQALRQMVITTSEGEWLDLWGTLYAESRRPGELDADYAARIPKEAFRIRQNPRAIEIAIKDATGYDVRIEEPWFGMFRLDESLLSGPDKFYDGDYVGYHLIKPTARGAINWPAVLEVINRNRAAGVLVLGPSLTYGSWVDASYDRFVHLGQGQTLPTFVRYEDRAFLDTGPLEDVALPNHPALYRRELLRSSHVVVDAGQYAAHGRTWRDYRLFSSAVEYTSQYWGTPALRTWDYEEGDTCETTAVIGSSHSRDDADPYWADVSLLLHLDGANGSTSFPDSGPKGKTITPGGNVKITTADSKFGGASAVFDGAADYLDVSGSSSDFTFGTGDFTIEMFACMNNQTGNHMFYDGRAAGNGIYPTLYAAWGSFRYLESGTDKIVAPVQVPAGTWFHIALSRVSGVTRLFINGVQRGGSYTDTNNYLNATNRPRFGTSAGGEFDLSGKLDEIRITKGVGRYSSNFTPPSAPFPSST